jgi:hypothetical protein
MRAASLAHARVQPRRGKAVRAIGSSSDDWNAHYSTPLSTADQSTADDSNPFRTAHYSDAYSSAHADSLSNADYSNPLPTAHYSAHYSTAHAAHADSLSNADYDADPRRRYCSIVLGGALARANACG